MISARQRGTARANIDKFNNVAKVNKEALSNDTGQAAASSTSAASASSPSSSAANSPAFRTRSHLANDAKARLNKATESSSNFDKAEILDLSKGYELNCVRRRSGARKTIEMFNKVAEINKEKLDRNPFSETYSIQRFDTEATDYGRPPKGSKTEARGIKAGVHVMREVLFLMETINEYAQGEPPNKVIKFGPLFSIYENYSDKLVGMLLRARKYKLVEFEGEMLYQRQDDHKIIRQLLTIEEIRKTIQPSNDPVNCIAVQQKD